MSVRASCRLENAKPRGVSDADVFRPVGTMLSQDADGHEDRMLKYIYRVENKLDIFTGEPISAADADESQLMLFCGDDEFDDLSGDQAGEHEPNVAACDLA